MIQTFKYRFKVSEKHVFLGKLYHRHQDPFLSSFAPYVLTKDVSKNHMGSEGGFQGWGQSDTSWVYQWYKVSKYVFGKAVLSLVAEFQK